jgi:hypothetical protein
MTSVFDSSGISVLSFASSFLNVSSGVLKKRLGCFAGRISPIKSMSFCQFTVSGLWAMLSDGVHIANNTDSIKTVFGIVKCMIYGF